MSKQTNPSRFAIRAALALSAGSLVLGATPVLAQEGGGYLEEVVVTAQKREENLQDVPVAVTALTAGMIEDRGIKNLGDLLSTAPGLSGYEAPSARGNIGVNMRGVGSGNANSPSVDPANALYVDGIYLGKATGVGVDAIDLERIEVLRGPQGTLYGRNSTGGAINFITRKPTGEFNFKGTLSTGNYGLEGINMRVDLPMLGDALATSFSYNSRERDHLYRNTNPSGQDFENIDRQSWRFAAQWDVSDTLGINYSYDHSELDENTQALDVVGFNPSGAGVLGADGFPFNTSIRSRNRVDAVAGLQQFLPFLGPAFQTPQVQQLNQWMSDYIAYANDQLATPSARRNFASNDTVQRSVNDVDGHALTIAWDRGDMGALGDVTFKSITGWREVENLNTGDLDGIDNSVRPGPNGLTTGVLSDLVLLTIGGLFFDSVSPQIPGAVEFGVAQSLVDAINANGGSPIFNNFATTDYEQFSQEFQMVGATDTTDYVLGLYYFDDESEFRNNRTSVFPISSTATSSYDNATTAKSVFGQFTWRPEGDSPWALTGGLRYTKEDKDVTYLWRSAANPAGFFGPFFAGMSPAVSYVPNELAEQQPEVAGIFGKSFSNDFSNLSGKLTLAYRFSDDVSAFATYSTGYRSGGFNGDFYDSANDTADAFDEETIDNFEIGVKSEFWDRRARLNATYFSYSYDDLQVSQLLPQANGTVTSSITNAGQADRDGVELEFLVLPTENLSLSLNYTYVSGAFEKFPALVASPLDGGAVLDVTDVAERGSFPDHQVAFSVDWLAHRFDFGELRFNLSGISQSEMQAISLNSGVYDTNGNRLPDTPAVFEQASSDQRTLINARIALEEIQLGDGTLTLGLWGKNLTDDDHRAFSFNYGEALGLVVAQYGEPRTYGLDLTYQFR